MGCLVIALSILAGTGFFPDNFDMNRFFLPGPAAGDILSSMSDLDASTIWVIKHNLAGQETWRYPGRLLEIQPDRIILEAFFNRPDLPFHGIVLAQGDRFVETYWTDRWHNIFAIHDLHDGRLKAWYCNVACPAQIALGQVSYIDLALDLLVYADGRQLVLDEDEFASLPLLPAWRAQALAALIELQALFARRFSTDAAAVDDESDFLYPKKAREK